MRQLRLFSVTIALPLLISPLAVSNENLET